MNHQSNEIIKVDIEYELKNSYLDYAMSVIVGRALPDIRDGLKPVHRRVLFGMKTGGYDFNKPHKKSARIVGDVIGKYHPHGDSAVYDTITRMAQDFSLRYTLVDGQGNFGSIDGDPAAAMRYTEVRMTKIAHSLLTDLEKDTVNFSPNYDGSELVPDVLPTKIPNLLVNGSSGIAVGMATNIAPHNLNEVIDACIAYLHNSHISIEEITSIIPGPDFPTGGIINGREGIRNAYSTGRGKIYLRAKTEVKVDNKGRESIIITEIPYQVNKAKLIESIYNLVKNKKIEGISSLRDESDKDGLTVVIEIKRDAQADIILNQLFALTQMQVTFGMNMVALDRGQPKLVNIKNIIAAFIDHRCEVISRRSIFDINKINRRLHTLEGLGIALFNIEKIINTIRTSESTSQAKEKLLNSTWNIDKLNIEVKEYFLKGEISYKLDESQIQSILDIKLQKLTHLEQDKIFSEYLNLIDERSALQLILDDRNTLIKVVSNELNEVKTQFGDKRKTEIQDSILEISKADLIAPEDVIVTLSHDGYIKYQPISEYDTQHRGGKGKVAAKTKENDFIENIYSVNTHDTLLCFSNLGTIYWIKVYDIPLSTRNSKGKPIVNVLPLAKDEKITATLPIKEYNDTSFIVMATANGMIKKTLLSSFSRPRSNGIIAIKLKEGDQLINAELTNGNDDIMLFSSHG
ncbi:MAG: DNA gyrase subunit A, partial [Psittacicella sp.]